MIKYMGHYREDWDIRSNAESGEGFSDILIEIENEGIGIVIEVKYADNGNLDAECKKAMEQIKNKAYDSEPRYISCWFFLL